MSCPCIPEYRGTEIRRPTVIAALLSANPKTGLIQPADGVRFYQRDLNELHNRGLAHPYRMRVDRLWAYRLTETGRCVAEDFTSEGWTFDGWDVWNGEEIVR